MIEKFKGKYKITSNRKKDHDYSTIGSYFITICTRSFNPYFGFVENGVVILNKYGKLVSKFWSEIPNHFSNVMLDAFVVMPNHIHGILIIVSRDVALQRLQNKNHDRTRDVAVQRLYGNKMSEISPQSGSISTIIRSFKSICTREINMLRPNYFQWQSNYHDRIIRSHYEFLNVQKYIINNPHNWSYDEFKK